MTELNTPEMVAEAWKDQIREAIKFLKSLPTEEIWWAEDAINEYRITHHDQAQNYDEATGWNNQIASELLNGDGSEWEILNDTILGLEGCGFKGESPSSDDPMFWDLYSEIDEIIGNAQVERLIQRINQHSDETRKYIISKIK